MAKPEERFKGQHLEWDDLLTPVKSTPLPGDRGLTRAKAKEMDEKFRAAMRKRADGQD